MSGNTFGTIFRITTWGESHGRAVGVVVDGCPAGLAVDPGTIDAELVSTLCRRIVRSPPRPWNSPVAESVSALPVVRT